MCKKRNIQESITILSLIREIDIMAVTYSVIIPHYNIPTLLQRCLSTIPKRKDLEIIIVDDNSSPNIVDFEHFPGSDRSDCTIIFDKKGGSRVCP